jgi:hypothetical protein
LADQRVLAGNEREIVLERSPTKKLLAGAEQAAFMNHQMPNNALQPKFLPLRSGCRNAAELLR